MPCFAIGLPMVTGRTSGSYMPGSLTSIQFAPANIEVWRKGTISRKVEAGFVCRNPSLSSMVPVLIGAWRLVVKHPSSSSCNYRKVSYGVISGTYSSSNYKHLCYLHSITSLLFRSHLRWWNPLTSQD